MNHPKPGSNPVALPHQQAFCLRCSPVPRIAGVAGMVWHRLHSDGLAPREARRGRQVGRQIRWSRLSNDPRSRVYSNRAKTSTFVAGPIVKSGSLT